jgi:hypothetical protein
MLLQRDSFQRYMSDNIPTIGQVVMERINENVGLKENEQKKMHLYDSEVGLIPRYHGRY